MLGMIDWRWADLKGQDTNFRVVTVCSTASIPQSRLFSTSTAYISVVYNSFRLHYVSFATEGTPLFRTHVSSFPHRLASFCIAFFAASLLAAFLAMLPCMLKRIVPVARWSSDSIGTTGARRAGRNVVLAVDALAGWPNSPEG